MNKICLILAIPLLLITTAGAQSRLVSGTNEFTFDFYQEAIRGTPGNIFISPLSISMALGMIYPGAEGKTAIEMRAALHFLNDVDVQNQQYQDLVKSISGPKSPLIVTNTAWLDQGTIFKDDFVAIQKKYFESSFREVNFLDIENTRKQINAAIEEQTREKIKDLIPQGGILLNTRLILTNALYFKDTWMRPFKPGESTPGDFHAIDKISRVTFMKSKGEYQAFENSHVKILELPYSSGDKPNQFSMLIILPKEDIQSFERDHFTAQNLEEWYLRTIEMTKVMIPKFKMEHTTKVRPVLQELGMNDPFGDNASFTGICVGHSLRISNIFHKAFIEVNEEGTEAAAATAVGAVARSMPQEGEFIANKPFIFLIREKSTKSIVMIGRVMDPAEVSAE